MPIDIPVEVMQQAEPRDIDPMIAEWIKGKIKQNEGFRSTPYLDTKGIPTIGYGFNMQSGKYPQKMTREQADVIFNPIYEKAVSKAMEFAGPTWEFLNPAKQAILTDMAYNLGNKLDKFVDMRKALFNMDDAEVRKEMKDSDWYNQTKSRAKFNVENWY